ncbi:uracil-DNA glycosylase [Cryptococcus deuterogattii LA55]|nr:uracil-DNA glycosylase [Cryptococcus deuterogattii LA55]KIR35736.1 uracil-DNA glycosylase [Cryptococcus deuterogattii MMRL2647]KIR72708.1 uracil-DNA glycosylase [Cryptococcus deuterogattii CA1014]KIR95111.1 uracil-DNA glycosylase [Cryptococcus deuterogattii CBS 10090]KIS00367.1 uracil-DNA glycosylase [Cryptococcus deuterogattii 2001/935-1]
MSPKTRSISSYFIKPAAAAASASSRLANASASSEKSINTAAKNLAASPSEQSKEDIENMSPDADKGSATPASGPVKKRKLEETSANAISTSKTAKVTESASTTLPFKTLRPTSIAQFRERIAGRPSLVPLLELEMSTMGEDWFLALQDEFTKPYFIKLKEFVTAEQKTKKVFPPAGDIYSWSRFCPLKDDDGQAHGLAFSVRKGVRVPPSLRNMYQEMAQEIPGFVQPKHGDLTEWAKHGVLLLNTSLTVRAHEAGSHAKAGWDQFTAAVLRVVTNRLAPTSGSHVGGNGVVFMAWGAHAAKMCAGIDTVGQSSLKCANLLAELMV